VHEHRSSTPEKPRHPHGTGRKIPGTRGSSCINSRNFRLWVCWVPRSHPRGQCWLNWPLLMIDRGGDVLVQPE
jgi:hypothetical protein